MEYITALTNIIFSKVSNFNLFDQRIYFSPKSSDDYPPGAQHP